MGISNWLKLKDWREWCDKGDTGDEVPGYSDQVAKHGYIVICIITLIYVLFNLTFYNIEYVLYVCFDTGIFPVRLKFKT